MPTGCVTSSLLTFRPGSEGAVRGIVVLVQDVTEQKTAEQALRDSEERFRRIVEIAAEGIWIVDGDGRTTFVNQRMSDLLGYPPEEMMGRTYFDFMDAEEHERAKSGFARRKQGYTDRGIPVPPQGCRHRLARYHSQRDAG